MYLTNIFELNVRAVGAHGVTLATKPHRQVPSEVWRVSGSRREPARPDGLGCRLAGRDEPRYYVVALLGSILLAVSIING